MPQPVRSAPRTISGANGWMWESISPGRDRGATGVDHLGGRAQRVAHLGVGADRDDHAVAGGDSRGLGPRVVERTYRGVHDRKFGHGRRG